MCFFFFLKKTINFESFNYFNVDSKFCFAPSIFLFFKIVLPIKFEVSQNLLHDLTSKVSINENIQLLWKFHQNSTISMAFRWNSKGYFALGFGVSISGLDIIVAEKIDEEIILSDRWSQLEKHLK